MQCRACLTQVQPGQKFCPNCGEKQGNTCFSCHAEILDGAKFCAHCGAPQNQGEQTLSIQQKNINSDYAGVRNNKYSTLDWWSKRWWVTCKIEIYDSDQGGLFKKAPRSDLSHLSINEVISVLLDKNKPSLVVDVFLLDIINEQTVITFCGSDHLIHLNLSINGEDHVYRNDMQVDEVLDFLETLNLNGPKNTFEQLPRPPWDDA